MFRDGSSACTFLRSAPHCWRLCAPSRPSGGAPPGADDDFRAMQAGRFADLIAMGGDPSHDVSELDTLRWWEVKGG